MTSCTQDLCNSGSGYYPHDPTNTSDPDVEAARDNNDDNDNDNNDNQDNGDNKNVRGPYGNSASVHYFPVSSVVFLFVLFLSVILLLH